LSTIYSGAPPWEWSANPPGDAPYTYQVPGSLEVQPYTSTATYDGTNASGDFVPTLSIYSQSGGLLARVFPAATVTAGDTAEVTFMPPFGSAASTQGGGSTVTLAQEILITGSFTATGSNTTVPSWSHNSGATIADLTNPQNIVLHDAGFYTLTASLGWVPIAGLTHYLNWYLSDVHDTAIIGTNLVLASGTDFTGGNVPSVLTYATVQGAAFGYRYDLVNSDPSDLTIAMILTLTQTLVS